MQDIFSSETGWRLSNFANVGLGNIHRKRWLNPRSAPVVCSIIVLATLGWVKPPTVSAVFSM